MSEKKKVKLYVTATKNNWQQEFTLEVDTCDKTTWTHDSSTIYIAVSEVEVEIEIPTVEQKQLTLEEVKQLQAAIQKEMADSHVRVTAIEEKIQSLMCIENQSDKVGG